MTNHVEATTAFDVVERLRQSLPEPWDVFGERITGHELHLVGPRVEMARSPIRVEGFGLRVLRQVEHHTRVGFVASTDLTDAGIRSAVDAAEAATEFARFPAKDVSLPDPSVGNPETVPSLNPELWDRPMQTLEGLVSDLRAAFEGRRDERPSFGSLKLTLSEVTFANSAGLERRFRRSSLEFELAVKATGGPEGPSPGEFWTVQEWGALPDEGIGAQVDAWCRRAEDVRRARPPETGTSKVVFPTATLAEFVPAIVGFRVSGAARVHQMMPELGSVIASDLLTVHDDGLLPRGLETGPCDDEGLPHRRRTVIDRGRFVSGLYDVLHARLFDLEPTGHGHRYPPLFDRGPRFLHAPDASPTNLVIDAGSGGADEELAEAVGEGLWLEHLGYAFPDPISAHFGGEIRLGYRIHHGKVGEPVRGGTLGGLLLAGPGEGSLLRSIEVVGSRSKTVGSLTSPALVFRDVPVAGNS